MPGFWESLGQGLETAGGILSPDVYQANQQQRQNATSNLLKGLQVNQLQRKLSADQQFAEISKGMNIGGLRSSGEQFDAFMKAVPLDVLGQSEAAQQGLSTIMARQKQEEAQQAKMIQLQNQYDTIREREEYHRRMAARDDADAVEKARHNLAAEEESKRWHGLEEYLRRSGMDVKREAAVEKTTAPIQNIIDQTDAAIRQLDQNPQIAGGVGMFTRGKEFVESTFDPTTPTPASEFQSQLLGIQSQWRKLPTVAANRFKADYSKIDDQIKGLGTFTSYATARNNLVQFRDNLAKQIGKGQATPSTPASGGEDWISRAMKANPSLTREQVIEEGKKLGKLR